jgi:hypothetical protein
MITCSSAHLKSCVIPSGISSDGFPQNPSDYYSLQRSFCADECQGKEPSFGHKKTKYITNILLFYHVIGIIGALCMICTLNYK